MSYLTKTKEEQKTIDVFAKAFIKETNLDLQNIAHRFFIIGFRLQEAVNLDYVTALGYSSIEDLAENEFGFKRSTTYGLMQVYNFTAKIDGFRHTMEMKEGYKGYTYTQLLEICKMKFYGGNIQNKIKTTDSVRDIKGYVKFWNDYGTKNSTVPSCTLAEWKEMQVEEPPTSNVAPDESQSEQMTFDTTETEEEPNVIEETIKTPAPVQTFGQPTRAEPIPEEKPKYNFSTRAGVREFLKDCLSWKKMTCFSPFISCYCYTLKNKRRIYVYVQRKASTHGIDNIYQVVHRFFFDLPQYSDVPVEITKDDFEKYCEEHKDEL